MRVCRADRGEAEVTVQDDGAEIDVRVPAASRPDDTIVEVTLPDGTEWRPSDTGLDVLPTDGTLVLRGEVSEQGGPGLERLELTAVCR